MRALPESEGGTVQGRRALRIEVAWGLALALVLGAPGTAVADLEPNNALVQAEGPVAGGVGITGTITNSADEDWYVFYVQGQQQMHLTLTSTGARGEANCARASVLDTDGDDDLS